LATTQVEELEELRMVSSVHDRAWEDGLAIALDASTAHRERVGPLEVPRGHVETVVAFDGRPEDVRLGVWVTTTRSRRCRRPFRHARLVHGRARSVRTSVSRRIDAGTVLVRVVPYRALLPSGFAGFDATIVLDGSPMLVRIDRGIGGVPALRGRLFVRRRRCRSVEVVFPSPFTESEDPEN